LFYPSTIREVQPHAAETDGRYFQIALSEFPLVHCFSLRFSPRDALGACPVSRVLQSRGPCEVSSVWSWADGKNREDSAMPFISKIRGAPVERGLLFRVQLVAGWWREQVIREGTGLHRVHDCGKRHVAHFREETAHWTAATHFDLHIGCVGDPADIRNLLVHLSHGLGLSGLALGSTRVAEDPTLLHSGLVEAVVVGRSGCILNDPHGTLQRYGHLHILAARHGGLHRELQVMAGCVDVSSAKASLKANGQTKQIAGHTFGTWPRLPSSSRRACQRLDAAGNARKSGWKTRKHRHWATLDGCFSGSNASIVDAVTTRRRTPGSMNV